MLINGLDWRGKRVLVTGGSGFKGAYMCAAAARLGARVYAICRNHVNPSSAFALLGLEEGITSVAEDITDRQAMFDTINTIEPDIIVHLAAKSLVKAGLRNPRRTLDVNIMGTLNLIEACRRLRLCHRILICSTDHVFGATKPEEIPPTGFDVRDRVSYSGPYDTSKAAMELIVRMYHSTYWSELPEIGISRCANVFGPGDTNSRRIMPLFVTSAKAGRIDLKYRFNGRQFVYISDVIAGYIKAISSLPEPSRTSRPQRESESPFTPTFHFAIERYKGTEMPYILMKDLAGLVASRFGAAIDETGYVNFAPDENPVQALNCEPTRSQLSWVPRISLEEGIDRLGRWYSLMGNEASLKKFIHSEVDELISPLADSGETVLSQ